MVTFVIGPSSPLLSSCNVSSVSNTARTGFLELHQGCSVTAPEF
jgi:hypothetical protein